MDRLSSCYFCGGALDASLSEYPVVPKQLQPDEELQRSVVLCSTCQHKLADIVESVVTAAEADGEGALPSADRAGRDNSDDSARLLDGSASETQSDSPDGDADPESEGVALLDDESDVPEDGLLGAAETDATPSSTDSAATATQAPSDAATERSESVDTGQPAESVGTDQRDDPDAGSGGTADGPTLTKLEYSKVMRLLQNRDLPVDRAEIRDVAVNAYDIDPAQFDAIIDAAVRRDLIGQENGRLVSTE